MTTNSMRARALAAALLDGPWRIAAMIERLRATVGVHRPWLVSIARAAAAAHKGARLRAQFDRIAWT